MDLMRESNTLMNNKPLIECVRKFPLIQQFPSTIKEFNTEPWSKLKQLPIPSAITAKDSSNPSNVPCKKLRIVSPNGKDLGEFNVEIRGKNASKEQIYTITKFKPVSKPVILSLNPLAKKTLPRILKQPSTNIVRNKMMKIKAILPVKGNTVKKNDKLNVSSMERTVANKSNEIMDISDEIQTSTSEISDKEIDNSDNKMLTSEDETNQKLSLDLPADDSQKHPKVKDKLTTSTKNSEYIADNTLLKTDKVKTSTTPLENNKITSTRINMTYKEIAESPFPKVSCKKLIISNDNVPILSKVYKRKKTLTTKTTKSKKANKSSSKVLNCVRSYNQKAICSNKKGSTKTGSKNNSKSRNKQVGSSRRKNNSFQVNSKVIHKTKQTRGTKTRKDIMTIVPNHNNFSFHKNAISTLEHGKCHTKEGLGRAKDLLLDNVQSVSKSKDFTDMFDADVQLNKQSKDCSKDHSIQKNILEQWDLIKKAVNSVKDQGLRAQALKALADCAIGVERRVPKRPPEELKSVHDTQVQTTVFGLLDPKFFILINKDIESIQRIQQITFHDQLHPQDLPQNNSVPNVIQQSVFKNSNVIEEENDFDIDSFMNQICEEHLGALQVKESLSTTNVKYQKIIDQLQKDFELAKKYDEDGMLSIHNAVLKNNIFDVQRYLMVLKQCKENVDIMTMDGVTSLELAIKYDVRGDIVKLLLQSGAQPVKMEPLHESALIIAAKQSSVLLPMLVNHISNPKLLDQVDSEGFAALHYCCKNGDVEGVNALISAGANVDLKDMKSGRTPLFHALESDNTDNKTKVVHRLLRAEATTNITNFAGQPPLPLPSDEKKSTFMMSLRKSTKISSPSRYLL